MAKHKQPTGFMPGIYFGLSETEYHSDKALSHSGITDILVSPMDYWDRSPLNPHRSFKESEAMTFGKMCHMMLLEPDLFKKTYNIAGGGYHKDRKMISSNDYRLVKESTQILRSDPETNSYFVKGYPEVSIFWIDPATGIRLRIRVDYLRTFGCVDLKRLRSIQKHKLRYDIQQYGYDLQDHLYREGVKQVRALLRQGKAVVHGNVDPDWLKAFIAEDDTFFIFMVQRSTRPYIYRVWNFDEHVRAEAKIFSDRGIARYKHCIQTYGETGWPYGSAKAETFSIDDMARRHIDD